MFLLPYATDCERRRFPAFTLVLIVLNAAILGMQYAAGPEQTAAVALVPAQPTVLGAILSMFMHADPVHLAGNMLFLWVFGSTLEDRLGPWLYLGLYLGGGICAALGHIAVAWLFQTSALNSPVVGASGAVAALVGMFGVRFYRNKVRVFYLWGIFLFIRWGTFEVGALWAVGFFLVENLLFALLGLGGLESGVAYWAHLAGLLFGVGAGLVLGLNREASEEYETEELRAAFSPPVEGPPGQAELRERVLRNPGDLQSVVWLGQTEMEQGRVGEAVDVWARGLQHLLLEPPGERLGWYLDQVNEGVLRTRLRPSVQYQTALALERAGQYERALSWLEAVAEHPEAEESAELALLRQASVRKEALEDTEGAARDYASFLERFPDSRWSEQARQGWEAAAAA